jgi:hypothetical protein
MSNGSANAHRFCAASLNQDHNNDELKKPQIEKQIGLKTMSDRQLCGGWPKLTRQQLLAIEQSLIYWMSYYNADILQPGALQDSTDIPSS